MHWEKLLIIPDLVSKALGMVLSAVSQPCREFIVCANDLLPLWVPDNAGGCRESKKLRVCFPASSAMWIHEGAAPVSPQDIVVQFLLGPECPEVAGI